LKPKTIRQISANLREQSPTHTQSITPEDQHCKTKGTSIQFHQIFVVGNKNLPIKPPPNREKIPSPPPAQIRIKKSKFIESIQFRQLSSKMASTRAGRYSQSIRKAGSWGKETKQSKRDKRT
jgi:hypothetical protein